MTIRHQDGLPDDRVTCSECRHCDGGSYFCRKYRMPTLAELPLRCMGFDPLPSAADQRNGSERWPTMKKDIEEARALEVRAPVKSGRP
jgi:hypothetical protein